MSRPLPNFLCSLLLLCACTSNSQRSEWSDIDYERIAQENYRRQNDQFYTPPPPSVIGCVDDDLYNCRKQGYRGY